MNKEKFFESILNETHKDPYDLSELQISRAKPGPPLVPTRDPNYPMSAFILAFNDVVDQVHTVFNHNDNVRRLPLYKKRKFITAYKEAVKYLDIANEELHIIAKNLKDDDPAWDLYDEKHKR
jgi:hypothetical protein